MTEQTRRFGFSDSIHLLPLLHPLLAGWVVPGGFRLELVAMAPAELNEAVAAGALDGALLDPVTFSRLRSSLEPLPGLGLASEGGNGAAVLQSSVRADDLDGALIVPGAGAAEGMAEWLMRVLQEPYFGIAARIEAEGQEQAKLLAGDEAVRARSPWLRYEAQFSAKSVTSMIPEPDPAQAGYATDLGAAWWVLTGTPVIWALAAVRQEMLADEKQVVELVRVFRESRRSAQDQLDTVVSTAAKRSGEPEQVIRQLFAAQKVEIGGRELAGLNIFYDHTKRLRLTR